MTDVKPGDTVRVTFVTDVRPARYGDEALNAVRVGHPQNNRLTTTVPVGTVELIKRADNPEADPIGTIRQSPPSKNVFVKIRRDVWVSLRNVSGGETMHFSNSEMDGLPKIDYPEVQRLYGHAAP